MRRHVGLLVVCLLLGLGGGIGWDAAKPRQYSATAYVLLATVPTHVDAEAAGRAPRDVTIDTDGQLVRSWHVAVQVSRVVGQPATSIVDRLSVSAPPLTRVLRISFTDTQPATARLGANAAADALIAARGGLLVALQDDQLASLRSELRRLSGEIEAVRAGDRARLEALRSQAATLRHRLDDIVRAQEESGVVVRAAREARKPLSSNYEVSLTSGAALGLASGIVLGLLLDRVRRRSASRSSTSSANRDTEVLTSSAG